MKIKLLLFGAGKNAEKIINCIKPEVEVAVLVDNDSSKWGKNRLGVGNDLFKETNSCIRILGPSRT